MGWEAGTKREFAFDPNSTENEGRFRLYSPASIEKDSYFRRKSSTAGVSYVMGKASAGPAEGKSVIQAVRFDKETFTEAEAAKWWSKNHGRENLVFSDERKKEAMNKTAVATELVKIAKELVSADDSAEDIAADVSSRMDAGMSIADAFRDIGYAELWRHTLESNMPRNWEHQPSSIRLKMLTKAIEKAVRRTPITGAVLGKAIIDVPLRMRWLPNGETLPEYRVSFDGKWFGWQQFGAGANNTYSDESRFRYSLSQELRSLQNASKLIDMLKERFGGEGHPIGY